MVGMRANGSGSFVAAHAATGLVGTGGSGVANGGKVCDVRSVWTLPSGSVFQRQRRLPLVGGLSFLSRG